MQPLKYVAMLAMLCLGLGAFSAAQGADVYPRASTKDVYQAPTLQAAPVEGTKWTGFWLGGALGYGDQLNEIGLQAGGTEFINLDGLGGSGFVYDARGGADIRIPVVGILAGFEGGIMGSNIETSARLGDLDASYQIGTITWIAARLGKTFADDQALIYVKGGLAWNDPEDLKFTGGSLALDDRQGYVLGAGLEAHLGSGFFAFAEYNHFQFDQETVVAFEGARLTEETAIDVGQAGIKWKFGGGEQGKGLWF
jgi:opacity protein-like surface antigen